jgi:hypothetical protein
MPPPRRKALLLLGPVLLAAALLPRPADAHGMMVIPESRNWKAYMAVTENCPHCLNGGGAAPALSPLRPIFARVGGLKADPTLAGVDVMKQAAGGAWPNSNAPVCSLTDDHRRPLSYATSPGPSVGGSRCSGIRPHTPAMRSASRSRLHLPPDCASPHRPPLPAATYSAGGEVEVHSVAVNNHYGRIGMWLCPQSAKTQGECTQLARADGVSKYWYFPRVKHNPNMGDYYTPEQLEPVDNVGTSAPHACLLFCWSVRAAHVGPLHPGSRGAHGRLAGALAPDGGWPGEQRGCRAHLPAPLPAPQDRDYKWYPFQDSGRGVYSRWPAYIVKFKLPDSPPCEQCVLQWYWVTSHK